MHPQLPKQPFTPPVNPPWLQGRVTDHRVGVTEHGMEGVLSGERLGVFVEALQVHHQGLLLANLDAAGGR